MLAGNRSMDRQYRAHALLALHILRSVSQMHDNHWDVSRICILDQ